MFPLPTFTVLLSQLAVLDSSPSQFNKAETPWNDFYKRTATFLHYQKVKGEKGPGRDIFQYPRKPDRKTKLAWRLILNSSPAVIKSRKISQTRLTVMALFTDTITSSFMYNIVTHSCVSTPHSRFVQAGTNPGDWYESYHKAASSSDCFSGRVDSGFLRIQMGGSSSTGNAGSSSLGLHNGSHSN